MIDFHSVSIEDVWAALPEDARANPHVMKRLQESTPGRAVANYTDLFWEDDPNDAGRRRRSIDDDKILPLMMRLYIHLGGTETEKELEFWKRVI